MKMKKVIMLLVLICLLSCEKQEDKLSQFKVMPLLNPERISIDFVIKNNQIWSLLDNGDITVLNINHGKIIERIHFPWHYIKKISMDQKENIVIVDSTNTVFRYFEDKNSWVKLFSSVYNIFGIVFSTNNECLALTNSGIYDYKTHQLFTPSKDETINLQRTWIWSVNNPVYRVDKQNNLWLAFSFGEWGGVLYKFNISTRQFENLDYDFFGDNITSMTQFKNLLLFSSSTFHMGLGLGEIFSIVNNKEISISDSKLDKNRKNLHNYNDEYIAQINYCEKDSSIYAITQFGFYKSNPVVDINDSVSWKQVLPKTVHYSLNGDKENTNDMNNTIFTISNTKMQVLNQNHIILATYHQGIGIYNGKQMIFVRPKSVNDRARIIVEVK